MMMVAVVVEMGAVLILYIVTQFERNQLQGKSANSKKISFFIYVRKVNTKKTN
jgi:hypothetical protein